MLQNLVDPNVLFTVFGFIILIVSVIIHEVMHGVVALKFGDHTAENAGRITLNPIPHIDPIGTILMPLLSFISHSGFFLAWAKPVPVNPMHFNDIKKGEIFVSAAGITSNFALACVCAIFYHLAGFFNTNILIYEVLRLGVAINLFLAIFNLIPVPPLDGSKILIAYLPYEQARLFQKYEMQSFILLFILVYLGVIGAIIGFIAPFFFRLLQVPTF